MTITYSNTKWNPSWSGIVEPSLVPDVMFYPQDHAIATMLEAGLEKQTGCQSCCFDVSDPNCLNHKCDGGIFLSTVHLVTLKLEQ